MKRQTCLFVLGLAVVMAESMLMPYEPRPGMPGNRSECLEAIEQSRLCKQERNEAKKEKMKAAMEAMQQEMERIKPEILAECNADETVMAGGSGCTCQMEEDNSWKKTCDCMTGVMEREIETCPVIHHFMEDHESKKHKKCGMKEKYGDKESMNYEMIKGRHKRYAQMEDKKEGDVMKNIQCETEGEDTKKNFARCTIKKFHEKMADFNKAMQEEEEKEEPKSPEEKMAEINECEDMVPPQCRMMVGQMRHQVCQCVNNIVERSDRLKKLANVCIPEEMKDMSCMLMAKFMGKMKKVLFEMSDICENNKMQWYWNIRNQYKRKLMGKNDGHRYGKKGKGKGKGKWKGGDKKEMMTKMLKKVAEEKPEVFEKIEEMYEEAGGEGDDIEDMVDWVLEEGMEKIKKFMDAGMGDDDDDEPGMGDDDDDDDDDDEGDERVPKEKLKKLIDTIREKLPQKN